MNFNPMFSRVQRLHFVGIGGAGMSGLAEIFLREGYTISGSDIALSATVERLRRLGISIALGHSEDNIKEIDVVVISSAIAADNPEIIAAKKQRIPIIARAQMLAELMRFRYGIAVAGTHGKTTTTSLIASVLTEAGLDPTFVIGGRLIHLESHASLGNGKYLVAEADESDASFLHLQPIIAVITNIDMDHMETYHHRAEELYKNFNEFLQQLPFYGLAIACFDDPGVQSILEQIPRKVLTYGFNEKADLHATDLKEIGLQTYFTVKRPYCGHKDLSIRLNLAGKHNVLNALATIGVATELGIPDKAIQLALEKFSGVERRFQIHGHLTFPNGKALLIDDYGHHPNEIAATLATIRTVWQKRRLIMIYQLHRYSRTRDLYEDFVQILSKTDILIMLNVYGAGELPIQGADARSMCNSIRQRGQVDPIFIEETEDLLTVLKTVICEEDILLMQGAGNISSLVKQIIKLFQAQ